MRILYAASEVAGFAKTGGLADVLGSLPRALAQRGHECAVIMPLYRGIRSGKLSLTPTGHTTTVPLGSRALQGGLWRSTLPDSDVPVYLVEQAELFERDGGDRDGTLRYQFFKSGLCHLGGSHGDLETRH